MGKVTATSGDIAGWRISENWISKTKVVTANNRVPNEDAGTYEVVVSSLMYDPNTSNSWSPPAFGVSKTKNGKTEWPFLVRSNGELTAARGYIANWQIHKNELSCTTAKDANGYQYTTEIIACPNNGPNDCVFTTSRANPDGSTTWVFAVRPSGELIAAQNKFIAKADGSLDIGWGKMTLDTEGNLSLTGTVNATGGTIGGWTLTKSGDGKDTYLYHKDATEWQGTGMAYVGTWAGPCFWAGCYTDTPWSANTTTSLGSTWADNTKFYVTADGYLKAMDANITGTIKAKEGYSTTWNVYQDNTFTTPLGYLGSVTVPYSTTKAFGISAYTS
jgi:hypothetical protein